MLKKVCRKVGWLFLLLAETIPCLFLLAPVSHADTLYDVSGTLSTTGNDASITKPFSFELTYSPTGSIYGPSFQGEHQLNADYYYLIVAGFPGEVDLNFNGTPDGQVFDWDSEWAYWYSCTTQTCIADFISPTATTRILANGCYSSDCVLYASPISISDFVETDPPSVPTPEPSTWLLTFLGIVLLLLVGTHLQGGIRPSALRIPPR